MAAERKDFIRDIIDDDLASGRHQRVATRFPPEPNGYLHIGHAKSICLNFGLARDYRGTCNLRYDDTNPAKEDVEYVESIERDVRWLGFEPSAVLFSADYFPRMYELAEKLVQDGHAYVCDLDDAGIKDYRGTLSEPGRPSPFRDRTPAENLELLRRMKAGEFPDGARTLRAKIDMASANMKMRDPLLYRIRHAHHHRSGDAWCIYPMYDYAHPLEDAIEQITHSICTLEFENNRELYDWVIATTGISAGTIAPRQYEFARLALEYTVMSKRKLLMLVKDGHVTGWDDPRMPTISAMRRRGYAASAIREFCDMIGVAKANSFVDIGKLEYCIRDELNQNAPRALGVLEPVTVELVNWSGDPVRFDAPTFPPDIGKPGTRGVQIGATILIDRDDWRDDEPGKDYQRLAPGRTVRLRHGPCITATGVERAGDRVTKIIAEVHADTFGGKNPDGKKPSGVIHWVDAATSVAAEVRVYERLFKSPQPEDGGADFVAQIDRDSLAIVTTARLEASLATAAIGDRFQLERVGYFVIDEDSRPGALVLNRIVTLRDARVVQAVPVAGPTDKPKNAKAERRPKSKSPQEYRAEARVRDPELAESYAKIAALVSAEQADLLSGDHATANLFLGVVADVGFADIAAKWIINELPRALGDAALIDKAPTIVRFAELVELIGEHKLPGNTAKLVLADMVATGVTAEEAMSKVSTSTIDVGAQIASVLVANADKVTQYKAGKIGLFGFLVGQVMKASPGADAAEVNAKLRAALDA